MAGMKLETQMLVKARDSKKTVVIFFANGYQAPAQIVDFDDSVIVARVRNEEWLIYRSSLSTIAMGGLRNG